MASETIRRLRWDSLGCGPSALHAALFAIEPGQTQAFRIAPHCHDFFEALYVLDGIGEHHLLTATPQPQDKTLTAGDLLFFRPQDGHTFRVPPGGRLHWMNIAFGQAAWEAFRLASGLPPEDWDSAPLPPAVNLAGDERRTVCRAAFEEALHRFQRWRIADTAEPAPRRLDLCRFLGEVSHLLTETGSGGEDDAGSGCPPWLRRACLTFEAEPASLAEGLPRLVTLSGVTYAHLARSLKAVLGRTPTQYVNDLRLARAALLLTTTPRTIIEIAGECGFEQLSYFYRQFQNRFGLPPNAYRQAARRSVAP